MTYRNWTMSLLLTASLGACTATGDYALIYTPVCFNDSDLALEVVQRDRQAAEAIAVNNAQLPEKPC